MLFIIKLLLNQQNLDKFYFNKTCEERNLFFLNCPFGYITAHPFKALNFNLETEFASLKMYRIISIFFPFWNIRIVQQLLFQS